MESGHTLLVSKDGREPGAYATIGAALKALPTLFPNEDEPVTIQLAPGDYRERVEIVRPHVTLMGETAESVHITGGLGAYMDAPDGSGVNGKLGTFRTYVVLVDAHDVTLANLTIQNDAGDGREVGQGIALYADADRLVVQNCCIKGHQDTLFCGPLPEHEVKPGGFVGPKEFSPRVVGRQYYNRCRIEGDVDFIFGSARAFFEGCEIRSLDRGEGACGYVTAASTPEGEPYGFVFHGCSFTGEGTDATVYLGRPWRDDAQTVLVDCWLGAQIKPSGWWDWDKPAAHDRSFYGGVGLCGPGANARDWEPWAHELDSAARVRFDRSAVLAGDDGWDPVGGDGDRIETGCLSDNGRTAHLDIYFEDEPALRKRLKTEGRSAAFAGEGAEAWRSWCDGARARLRDILGLSLMASVPLEARELESATRWGSITLEHLLLRVEADVWMPFYLLCPDCPLKGPDGRALCYIAPHGHQGAGAASVAGLMGVPALDDAVRMFNYDYGLRLAQLGYVVACPDARGWGARRDWKGQGDAERLYLRGTCLNQARMAEPLGLSLAGLNTWDLMRLIDYLESRGDICMQSLGCFGFSGGGLQTLYLAALDERVSKAFISGYLYGVDDSLLHLNGNCSCNYVPGLWRLFDMGDIASLIAPRPLVVQSCADDHLNGARGLDNVEDQLKIVRSAYELLESGGKLLHEVCPGEHHLGVFHLEEELAWLDSRAVEICDGSGR